MRDAQVFQMNQATAQNVFKLFKSVANLEARQRALETVLVELNSQLGFKSKDLIERVNKLHAENVDKFNQAVKESAQKAQEEAKKPKLRIIPAIGGLKPVASILFVLSLSCFSLSSCVSASYLQKQRKLAYESGYRQGEMDALNPDGTVRTYDHDE